MDAATTAAKPGASPPVSIKAAVMSCFRRSLAALFIAAWCVGPSGDRDSIAGEARPAPSIHKADANSPLAADESTRMRNVVRLRKLHLVRPDLIPYPLAYEIYC